MFVSCNQIDLTELENQIEEGAVDAKSISCSTTGLPDKTAGGNIGSISQQGSDGTCRYRFDLTGVLYTPNDISFSNTDFCEFVYPESSITHTITVDYSDSANPTCNITSSGGAGGGGARVIKIGR